jgi:ribosome biogenesis GTPase
MRDSWANLSDLRGMKGLVLKSTGKWYDVKGDDGLKYRCQVRGKLRLKGLSTTNPVAAGDRVEIQPEQDDQAVITDVEERRNYIIRRSVNLSKEAQIVAANIDLAVLVITVAHPQTTFGFIDRFLVTAEAYRVPVVLLFHKMDQYDEDEIDLVYDYASVYSEIGYPCLRSSLVTGEGLHDLQAMMKDKVTLFSGHSGTGKSSLVNHFIPGLNARIGEISDWSGWWIFRSRSWGIISRNSSPCFPNAVSATVRIRMNRVAPCAVRFRKAPLHSRAMTAISRCGRTMKSGHLTVDFV